MFVYSQYSGMSGLVTKGKFVPIIGKEGVGENAPPQIFLLPKNTFLVYWVEEGQIKNGVRVGERVCILRNGSKRSLPLFLT